MILHDVKKKINLNEYKIIYNTTAKTTTEDRHMKFYIDKYYKFCVKKQTNSWQTNFCLPRITDLLPVLLYRWKHLN